MAHFAQLDENNVVTQVIVIDNNECLDADGKESEIVGIGFCSKLFGGNWKQTSYNKKIRKNYAVVGFVYNKELDAFIPPKPYPSWSLNETTCRWEPPVPLPLNNISSTSEKTKKYEWDESALNWKEIIIS